VVVADDGRGIDDERPEVVDAAEARAARPAVAAEGVVEGDFR
jgi:hypothetical protein